MSDKYLFLIIEGEWDSDDVTSEQHEDAMKAHGAFAAAVVAAGAKVLGGEALRGEKTAFSVVPGRDGKPPVFTNGPLTEATEVLSGYYLIEAPSEQVARELAPLCPTAGHIEVRPVWDMVV